jgi:cytochrome c peroxidase
VRQCGGLPVARHRLLAAVTGLGLVAAAPLAALADAASPLSAVATLGKAMFFDPALSGSGVMSCAFCHDPANHFAPSNDLAVQVGGPKMNQPGFRAVPTLTYKAGTPPFSIGPADATSEAAEAAPIAIAETSDIGELDAGNAIGKLVVAMKVTKPKAGDTSAAQVARGGMFWDGRADTLQEQALGPLLSPFEMANGNLPALAARIAASYGDLLGQLFGPEILKDPKMTVNEAAYTIARFEVEDASFHPFSSEYDAYLAGKVTLSPAAARGLKLFDAPTKGNCAACHLDKPSASGQPPLFTDFEFEALAVPRNPALPANADPAYHDLGLCGPLRTDMPATTGCGLFKTPTLRNVATRHVFFHNGVYTHLADAVRFYTLRDTQPARIYPTAPDGAVQAYNDLPPADRGNIDRIDAPLDRHPGDAPALTEDEVADIAAFLNTLTDGWQP